MNKYAEMKGKLFFFIIIVNPNSVKYNCFYSNLKNDLHSKRLNYFNKCIYIYTIFFVKIINFFNQNTFI